MSLPLQTFLTVISYPQSVSDLYPACCFSYDCYSYEQAAELRCMDLSPWPNPVGCPLTDATLTVVKTNRYGSDMHDSQTFKMERNEQGYFYAVALHNPVEA